MGLLRCLENEIDEVVTLVCLLLCNFGSHKDDDQSWEFLVPGVTNAHNLFISSIETSSVKVIIGMV